MNINFNFLSIYSYTWYIHNTYNNIYQNLWFNIYLKYYFLHIYARNVYYYKITYHVSFERNIEIFILFIYFKNLHIFPSLDASIQHRERVEMKSEFPPCHCVSFLLYISKARQISSVKSLPACFVVQRCA